MSYLRPFLATAPHTLDSLAERACLSSFHFARVFRAVTGVPPNTFMTALRYERAKELLSYWVGKGVGLVEKVTSAEQVVQEFMADFAAAAERLSGYVS